MRSMLLIAVLAALAWAKDGSALTLTVQESACRSVTAHRPSADVEYRPGVDIRGKRVAPADLNGGFGLELLDEVIIDISTDFAGRLTGRSPPFESARNSGSSPGSVGQLPQAPFFANGSVGTIVLEEGRLLFNGRPLQDPFEEELARLCAAARRGR